MIGMGKLGLPVALTIESKGFKVLGYDISPNPAKYLEEKKIPFVEKDIQPYLDKTKIEMVELKELIKQSDIIFCAIQTPHDPRYEGTTRIPEERADFDYSYIKSCIEEVSKILAELKEKRTVAIISTMLPGTTDRELRPLMNEYFEMVYTPQFIAMGTVINDYLNPEFNLIGADNKEVAEKMTNFYLKINDAPPLVTDVVTAEAIKVSYNTFITTKTVLANLWGEIAHKTGANADQIFKAWSLSKKRLLSEKYLQAGMGDGGGCHPRDNIALSYLADLTGMGYNYFDSLMLAREKHAEWQASLAVNAAQLSGLPIYILGKAFKPETNIETGSPSILLSNILQEVGIKHFLSDEWVPLKAVVFIGCRHKEYKDIQFVKGSIVIDPFGYIKDQEGVTVVRIGRK